MIGRVLGVAMVTVDQLAAGQQNGDFGRRALAGAKRGGAIAGVGGGKDELTGPILRCQSVSPRTSQP